MPCKTIVMGDGVTVIACSRGQSRKRCKCGRPADLLCDFPLSGAKSGKTCDMPICRSCATRVGPNRDYCPAHARMTAEKR